MGRNVTTGVGAALNTVDIRPGESVAVYGGGGLNVVQGARRSGANPIIAVDTDPSKLEIARQFGATDGVIAGKEARRCARPQRRPRRGLRVTRRDGQKGPETPGRGLAQARNRVEMARGR